eukprot:gnl/MRDRNA2_/MRDRNA2_74980_c0_seq1.p1 gnl/MRDRNA2_/MRDRNA2_74980_c0~~gnl/MRDRNA2_/MRDRNA2_74980_c0_seq1.p1  ORF type:complete len:102 (-),score=12.96 gnl/MRDRNA2_/MRDRNA2_74980_c0_seq1:350-655(-)
MVHSTSKFDYYSEQQLQRHSKLQVEQKKQPRRLQGTLMTFCFSFHRQSDDAHWKSKSSQQHVERRCSANAITEDLPRIAKLQAAFLQQLHDPDVLTTHLTA